MNTLGHEQELWRSQVVIKGEKLLWWKTQIFEGFYKYSQPFNNRRWDSMGPLTHGFFSKNICKYFWSVVGSLWIQRADCVQWSTPFYIEDLSIEDFGIHGWSKIPHGYWGTSKVFEKSKVIRRVLTVRRSAPLTLMLFKGWLYFLGMWAGCQWTLLILTFY